MQCLTQLFVTVKLGFGQKFDFYSEKNHFKPSSNLSVTILNKISEFEPHFRFAVSLLNQKTLIIIEQLIPDNGWSSDHGSNVVTHI